MLDYTNTNIKEKVRFYLTFYYYILIFNFCPGFKFFADRSVKPFDFTISRFDTHGYFLPIDHKFSPCLIV